MPEFGYKSLLVLLQIKGTLAVVCDSGWQEYSGGCYKSWSAKGTRDEALVRCQGFGASLVCINDAAENTFVKDQVRQNGLDHWLSHEMIGNSNSWKCLQETEAATYFKWIGGWSFDSDKKCTFLKNGERVWENDKCDAEFFYMCEKRDSNIETTNIIPDPSSTQSATTTVPLTSDIGRGMTSGESKRRYFRDTQGSDISREAVFYCAGLCARTEECDSFDVSPDSTCDLSTSPNKNFVRKIKLQ